MDSEKIKIYIYVVVIVTTLIVTVTGLTFAYFNWSSTINNQDINIDVTVVGLDDSVISYTKNTNNVELIPVSDKSLGRITNFSISQSGLNLANATFELTLEKLPQQLANKTLKYDLVSVTNNKETSLLDKPGDFENYNEGDKIILKDNVSLNKDITYNYKLYIWIDGNQDNPLDMQGKNYKFVLNVNLTDKLS